MGVTHLRLYSLGFGTHLELEFGIRLVNIDSQESINLIVVGLNVVVGLFRSKVYKDFCTNILNYYQHETNN